MLMLSILRFHFFRFRQLSFFYFFDFSSLIFDVAAATFIAAMLRQLNYY